ncbi:UvrD-helicase domain-containing protein [Muricauda sp. MAR_2010_75]|uniref:UvrD-helicase domain-containing protein n=1 Tax=Allomuricauda sp. MAR_2010_75 TaxID=1250232 RepID=UPI00055D4422|nr:UvrD-helicase domain-containing protein [Muricauda sp. MAR_2010_75]
MPQEINITNADIEYAERILLPEGKVFDEERRLFIRDLSTLDLQAVPGSGKTTALLAKLVILEKYMPLKNGCGVLVISHTNAAVDEINERIGKHCPKLFSYPNFVGTIQSFVDTFLAIPFYTNQFKQKPFRIDNEIYDEQVERFFLNTRNTGLKNYLDRQIDGLALLKSIRITTQGKLISYLNGTPETFKLKNPESPTYKSLLRFKINLLKKGYLHFDDAYSLAEIQLDRVKYYPTILQKRFSYVFVDEMQDMDIHQHDLIEKVFHPDINTLSVIQRIGDQNQAIYNGGSVHLESIWSVRDNVLYINGSHRLSPRVAFLVQNLALTPNRIDGKNQNPNGSAIDIKPTIFLYQDNSIELVIPAFADKIKELQNSSFIPINPSHKFMAVAWRKEHEDTDKIALGDYWPHFVSANSGQQIDFKVLEDYVLFFDKEKKTLESVRKNILNALLKILRLENVTDEYERDYTKRKLINFFRTLKNDEYELLKLNLYKWSIDSIKGKSLETIDSIRTYIPSFLSAFRKGITTSANFINGASEINEIEVEEEPRRNIFETDGISIEIGTVHSVKGQTHAATLYLETYFQKDGKGANAKSYESQRLAEQLLGNQIPITVGKRVKQSARMAYVGFSRPTHLLCIAIHKDRFERYLSNIDIEKWDIIEIES